MFCHSPSINAFCMPGGKIALFTGILEKLNLTDDEVAMIMGHEMGHALWEHARERTAKTNLTSIGSRVIGGLLFGQAGEMIGAAGSSLAALKFSRNDETEADLIGLELAARAGYDPRAGITLWQKMSTASKGAPPAWFSTHPAEHNRASRNRRQYERRDAAVRESQAGAGLVVHRTSGMRLWPRRTTTRFRA